MPYVQGYAGALRCIGQALDEQDIVAFELKCHRYDFRLQCGDPNPPYRDLISLIYSVEEIDALDGRGRARRGHSSQEVQFESLSSILRTMGKYLDLRNGHLLRICNSTGSGIELEYESRNQNVEREKLSMSSILEMSVRMYERRKTMEA